MTDSKIELRPVTQKAAKEYVKEHHRHHKPPVGSIFQVACYIGGQICGVAIAGRPVARMLQDGYTLEITRLCTNGTRNACSMLYSAVWRAAKALGYKKCVTYILKTENGASLRAANWKRAGLAGGGSWSTPSRKRTDKAPLMKKVRYEIQ